VVSGPIVYVLRTIRLAIGSDPGDLLWTAEDSKMQSLAGGPPRGQNGEADRDRYSLKWTVPLHTGSILDPNERPWSTQISSGQRNVEGGINQVDGAWHVETLVDCKLDSD